LPPRASFDKPVTHHALCNPWIRMREEVVCEIEEVGDVVVWLYVDFRTYVAFKLNTLSIKFIRAQLL